MPDFLGIGAMRSGTTWLATQLAGHPQIRLRRKEVHFFDRKLGDPGEPGSVRDLFNRARYVARVGWWPARDCRIGEITPAYAILEPDIVRRVHEWMPEVRLLFLMRDPVERAWSQARNDFPVWLGTPLEDLDRAKLEAFFATESVRRRSDYAACLRAWLGHFPRERFFFGFHEDIGRRPLDLLGEVYDFLGVDPARGVDGVAAGRLVGAAEPAPMPDWVRPHLEETWALDPAEVSELIGREVPWGR